MTDPERFAERIDAYFQHVAETAMRDLPICNPALRVESFGFRVHDAMLIGATVTPWFLNIFVLPLSPGPVENSVLNLPAGAVEFAAHDYPGLGRLLSCSLFSPMDIFVDHEAAAATAQASLELLFQSPEPPKSLPEKPALDRRAFFRFSAKEASL